MLSRHLIAGQLAARKYFIGAPFSLEPIHEFHKQIVKCCYYFHFVRTQFEPVWYHFAKLGENGFGVNGI